MRIPCEWRGKVEALAGAIEVAERRGCDLNPMDAERCGRAGADARLCLAGPGRPPRTRRGRLEWSPLRRIFAWRRSTPPISRRGNCGPAPPDARSSSRTRSSGNICAVRPETAIDAPRSPRRRSARRARALSRGCAWRPDAEERRGAILRLSLWPHGPIDEAGPGGFPRPMDRMARGRREGPAAIAIRQDASSLGRADTKRSRSSPVIGLARA